MSPPLKYGVVVMLPLNLKLSSVSSLATIVGNSIKFNGKNKFLKAFYRSLIFLFFVFYFFIFFILDTFEREKHNIELATK